MKLSLITVAALAGASAAVTAVAQKVDDRHPFKPGDIVSFGPNAYPVGATYRVVGCDPVDKPYRECRMIRRAPMAESHERPFVMDNYKKQLEIVGHEGAAATPAPTNLAPPAAPVSRPSTGVHAPTSPAASMAGRICPRSTYGGPVDGSVAPSAALFRQKIVDTMTMGNTPRGWYGVNLANFRVGGGIRNGVGQLPGGGASRVNNGAPVGATMYPVSTTMTVCEGWNGGSGSWRTSERKFLCFVTANREWTCGASN